MKSNCVSVEPLETELGRKRKINQSACNKDFSCIKGFCPSFVTVHGGKVRRAKVKLHQGPNEDDIADLFAGLKTPEQPSLDKPYNILITGIGGTGLSPSARFSAWPRIWKVMAPACWTSPVWRRRTAPC